MPGGRIVQRRFYRGHQLEVRDEAVGWSVVIHAPSRAAADREVLRNTVPRGLEVLLQEARTRVDRRCGDLLQAQDRW